MMNRLKEPIPIIKSTSSAVVNERAARRAGLTYISEHAAGSGIQRLKRGTAFRFLDAKGRGVRDAATLNRIKALVIPPAWTAVWICPKASGHIQVIGRDARGRKQYRYHADWTAARAETKYHKLTEFAAALPTLRKAVKRHLALPGLPREKVLAAVIAVTEKTLIRVGNEEYAEQNHSYGLTTLHDRHARISHGKVHFEFRGKSGVEHQIDLKDPMLAAIVRKCQDLPGQQLFQFKDHDGKVHDVTSSDVNDYLRTITGKDFTAKDFRTWAGTVLAATALREFEMFDSQAQAKKNILKAIESVAKRLGNTKAICRKCYIHPAVLNSYLDGHLVQQVARRSGSILSKKASSLKPEEAIVLTLLNRRLRKPA